MNTYIEQIKKNIEPLRQEIMNHKLYGDIKDVEDLKIFMEFHVYAVWDFMSLLKSLQRTLTCTSVPWFPVGSADTRYLINEIVVGEESDVDMDGKRMSHFELYLAAMKQSQADTSKMESFLAQLQHSGNLKEAFEHSKTPSEAAAFVDFTFEIINSNKDYLQAAIFTFGREDLIPGMFMSIVSDIDKNFPDSVSVFKYYLERHIEVDGDHHSHLALEMTANLCGDNPDFWAEAERVTVASLERRIELWNGAHKRILEGVGV
jgi:hypothetical protein